MRDQRLLSSQRGLPHSCSQGTESHGTNRACFPWVVILRALGSQAPPSFLTLSSIPSLGGLRQKGLQIPKPLVCVVGSVALSLTPFCLCILTVASHPTVTQLRALLGKVSGLPTTTEHAQQDMETRDPCKPLALLSALTSSLPAICMREGR